MKKEHVILYSALGAAILLLPTLNKKPSFKFWSGLFALNGVLNFFINKYLISRNYLTYPIRIFPKLFKTNVVYDFLICPYISIWYCQKSFHSNIKGIIGNSFLFAIPQILFEIWAERKTNLLQYKKMNYALVTIAIFSVKLQARAFLALFKKFHKL